MFTQSWFWVKGHAGHPENERADELACRGAEEAAAQAADNEWGPGASDIYGSLLSQATDEPAERDPSTVRDGHVTRLITRKYRSELMIIRPLWFVQSVLHLGRSHSTPVILAITSR